MPLPKKLSLSISCKAIAPFIDVDLLEKDNSGDVIPTAQAPGTTISGILKRLEKLDDEYDLHTIPSIMDFLHRSCWDAGYSLGMGPKQLLNERQVDTIDDLAEEVSGRSTKV